jgi:hypothetical protein
MSDASQLPAEVRESAVRSISAAGLPSAIERQAAAGGQASRQDMSYPKWTRGGCTGSDLMLQGRC